MPRVRVESVAISLDGFGAGPDQSIEHPLGVGGEALHDWVTSTRTWRRMHGQDGGGGGIDDEFAARSSENIGAWILGRNMFGPVRGPWPDMNWKGWWGNNPPYHVPVFVLTHHARPPLRMEGNTTFHFVTGGIHEALDQAREAAVGMDVRIGGGANTIQQYLRAGLIDELHVAIAPVLLGRGERLFEDIDLRTLGYACVQFVGSENATHVVLRRSAFDPITAPDTVRMGEGPYNGDMRSKVASELGREQAKRVAGLTPAERIALAEQLGEESIALYMATQHVDRRTAIARLEVSRRFGRRRSRSADR